VEKFSAIGAHIYAGGFTAGISKHFEVLAHLEDSGYGAEVVRLNFPDVPIYAGGPVNWPLEWPAGERRPRFLYANPPCAIWSGASAGRAGRWQDDPRLVHHHQIFDYATETVGVDVLAIESVPPSFTRGREHVDDLIERAADRGYSSTVAVHDAQYLGVPQARKRIFYVFHRVAIPWQHPGFGAPTTVRQALKGIRYRPGKGYDASVSAKTLPMIAGVPPGGRLQHYFNERNPDAETDEKGRVIGRPSFLEARAPWDRPAGVVIAGKTLHPEEDRYMSRDELAAICGFSKDFRWPDGDHGTISGYMSRGIMPPVGAWLAENVDRALTENRRINDPEATVFDVSRPPGRAYTLERTPSATVYASAVPEPVPVTRPRALLTGSTPIQVGSQKTALKIFTNAISWKGVLEDLGYDVEWRPVTPGEDLSGYAAVIAILNNRTRLRRVISTARCGHCWRDPMR